MYAESEEGGSSKTPLIIGGIVLLGVIGAIIYIVKKKSA
jgi:LPXTG-motif cell wall-anchored protein